MRKIAMSMVLATLLAACASTDDKQNTASVEDRTASQTTQQTKSGTDSQSTQTKSLAGNPLTDPNNILSKRSIYFDYDSAAIKSEYKPLIDAHARYLTGNNKAKVIIQGNTDERGSHEYNLALGQRRADSVRKMMNVLGVADSQIESVSLGEEKPRATGSDEAAYTENRRADIVYQGE